MKLQLDHNDLPDWVQWIVIVGIVSFAVAVLCILERLRCILKCIWCLLCCTSCRSTDQTATESNSLPYEPV